MHWFNRRFSGYRWWHFCCSSSDIHTKDPHKNCGCIFNFHRVFLFLDRLFGLRCHGTNKLAFHPSCRCGFFCWWAGRGKDHEYAPERKSNPNHFQPTAIFLVRKAGSPIINSMTLFLCTIFEVPKQINKTELVSFTFLTTLEIRATCQILWHQYT